jgi:hypothetical protein
MKQATLITMLRENRARFDALVAQIPDERMLEPRDSDGSTGKDLIAHLTAWEKRLIGWLKAARRGEVPKIPEPGTTWGDMDRLNARTLAENRARPLADVLGDSQRSFARLIAIVEHFSDAELSDPVRFSGFDVQPLWRRIAAGPGYGHYQAHFYDLLLRVPPEQRFRPDPGSLARYAGTYGEADDERIEVRVTNGQLYATRMAGKVHDRPTLALDATRFAYENGGLLTFFVAPDGSVTGLECWSYQLPRIAGQSR